MSKEVKFDFCIIPNPFSNGNRNMLFIAKSGDNFLDKSVSETKEYQDIKEILQQFGYTETNHLQFESSNNSLETPIKIIEFLKDCGLSYSRELEVNVIRDFDNIRGDKVDYEYTMYGTDGSVIEEKTKNKLIESRSELFKFKHKEPELKETVILYFYLFLEFGFNQFGKPIIQFGGDFKDSDNHDDRNYIKIVESEFKRVNDPKKPNSIVLSSCKTQADFLKEAGILYGGFFKYQRSVEKHDSIIVQEKKYPYKLAEIKKFLDPEQSIVVETNRMGYDKLISFSNKIKAESVVESRVFIPTNDIEKKAEELSQFLTKRMESLSEIEEFEEAAKMKKDVDFIKAQIEHVRSLERPYITTEEYFKLFYIS